ncbi:MAG: 3'-5' exonuclease [Dehalococcoidia bacterium]|nr:3'-5' exonuclease [Dehalococcoidia bacterium]
MLKNLKLERPLAFLDLETTGTNAYIDRIVELSIVKIDQDGKTDYIGHKINPTIPIPAEATKVHKITDADVANEPTFPFYAESIFHFLVGCDIAGFNVIKFDLPLLVEEFKRANIDFSYRNLQIVDCQVLYHLMEPRNLEAAYLKYCGKVMANAHNAECDAIASAEILDGQLDMYPNLPRDVPGLHVICNKKNDNYIDPDGKFILVNGEVICNFGKKHYGRKLNDIIIDDSEYLKWILSTDSFSPYVKKIVHKALYGKD